MTPADTPVVTERRTELSVTALADLCERAGDALMRAHNEPLALECYATAQRIRYVTSGAEDRRDGS